MPGLLDEEKNIIEVIINNAGEAINSPAFVDIPRYHTLICAYLAWCADRAWLPSQCSESLRAILSSDRVEETEVNLFNALVR